MCSIWLILAVNASLAPADAYGPRFTRGETPRALQGLVVDADSKPVEGAEVIAIATPRPGYQGLFPRDPTTPTLRGVSSDKGAFEIAVREHRSYELRIRTADGRIAYVPTCAPGESVTSRVAPPAEITLELVDAASGRPIPGVEVAALWTETALLRQFQAVSHRVASALTASDGRATLTNLPPGIVDIAYDPSTAELTPPRSWRVLAGEKSTLKLRVSEPRRTFAGRVTDRAGNAVPGARIATNVSFERFTIADDEGRFEITTFVPLGDLFLFAQADGFALEQRPIVDASRSESDLHIELPPGRAVTGRLVDAAAKALAGVPIVVVHDPFTTVPDRARGVSADDGSFRIHGLRADVKHVLVARSQGLELCVRSLGDAEFGTPMLDLGTLTLHPEATLAGRFLGTDAAPIAHAQISCAMTPVRADETPIEAPLDMPIGAVKTDADGRFRFDGLPAGGVTLTGLAPTTMKREVLGLERGGARTDVVIRSIAPVRKPSVELSEVGGHIGARVLLPNGQPAARVAVEILAEDESGSVVRQSFSDENGAFAFTELHGARYRLALELRDGFKDATPLRARRRLSPEELATLVSAPADSPSRSITLHEVVTVKGRVVDPREPDGRPWLVRVSPSGNVGAPTSVASDDAGRFSFAMEAGARLTIWLSPLALDPSVPRSALHARVVAPFPVHDLLAGADEIVIQVP